jgi:hypothetical protein
MPVSIYGGYEFLYISSMTEIFSYRDAQSNQTNFPSFEFNIS